MHFPREPSYPLEPFSSGPNVLQHLATFFSNVLCARGLEGLTALEESELCSLLQTFADELQDDTMDRVNRRGNYDLDY